MTGLIPVSRLPRMARLTTGTDKLLPYERLRARQPGAASFWYAWTTSRGRVRCGKPRPHPDPSVAFGSLGMTREARSRGMRRGGVSRRNDTRGRVPRNDTRRRVPRNDTRRRVPRNDTRGRLPGDNVRPRDVTCLAPPSVMPSAPSTVIPSAPSTVIPSAARDLGAGRLQGGRPRPHPDPSVAFDSFGMTEGGGSSRLTNGGGSVGITGGERLHRDERANAAAPGAQQAPGRHSHPRPTLTCGRACWTAGRGPSCAGR